MIELALVCGERRSDWVEVGVGFTSTMRWGLAAEAYDSVIERLRSRGYTVLDHDHSGSGRHLVEFWTWDVATHLQEFATGASPGSH